jgi:hypothetical protein
LANRLLHHDGAPQLGPVNIHHLLERLTDLLQAEPQAAGCETRLRPQRAGSAR